MCMPRHNFIMLFFCSRRFQTCEKHSLSMGRHLSTKRGATRVSTMWWRFKFNGIELIKNSAVNCCNLQLWITNIVILKPSREEHVTFYRISNVPQCPFLFLFFSIVGSILVADRILLTDSWIFASIGQQKQQINVVMNTRARHVQTNLQHCLVGEPLMCLGSQKCGCCLTNRLQPIEVMTFDHVIMSSRHFRRHFLFQPLDSQLHGVAHGHHGWFGNYGVKKEILHFHFCNGTVTTPVHKFNRWTVQDWVPTPKHVLITKNIKKWNWSMNRWFPFLT